MAGRRGYRVIEFGESEVPVLYTNRAIANAERVMEKGIIGVLSGFQQGGSGIFEVAVLLQAGAEAARRVDRLGGKRVTMDTAYEILDELGFSAVAAIVFEAIGEVLSKDAESDDAEFEDEKN